MKKMIATVGLIFCGLVLGFGISLTDLNKEDKWKVVGQNEDSVIAVNMTSIAITGVEISFDAVKVHLVDSKPDEGNYAISHFLANCETYLFLINHDEGKDRGEIFDRAYEGKDRIEAPKNSAARIVISVACEDKLGVRTE